MWESDASRLLEPCCIGCRHERLRRLLRPTAVATDYAPMLHHVVRQRTPSRLHELQQCLFGVLVNDDPFWGVYDCVKCPTCRRDLHVLAIDGQMIAIVDHVVRKLYPLLDAQAPDDLVFRSATPQEQQGARRRLAKAVFRQPTDISEDPMPVLGTTPYAWLTEAMLSAYVFLVIHETSHQGPQAALGAAHYGPLVATAQAGAAKRGITLGTGQADAWARELHADLNAVLIMRTDAFQLVKPQIAVPYGRALLAGVALALGVWDLIMREYCYGDALLTTQLVRTHPPASFRIELLRTNMAIAAELQAFAGDTLWAERLLDALSDLHG